MFICITITEQFTLQKKKKIYLIQQINYIAVSLPSDFMLINCY